MNAFRALFKDNNMAATNTIKETPLMTMFVVYCKPLDYPDEYVVRRHYLFSRIRQGVDRDLFARAPTLEGVRVMLPYGLTYLRRFKNDDTAIVETWV